MDLAKILSLSFVMVVGPQILTAIFLATSTNWRQNSLAFIAGAGTSVTIVTTAAYLLSTGVASHGTSRKTIYVVVLALLVIAGMYTFINRKKSKPPKWMGKLERAQPKDSYKLGFLLVGFFPSDLLTSIVVGGYMAGHKHPWVQTLPFTVTTLAMLAVPSVLIAVFGKRAQAFLPTARNWMNNNSWIVSEIVLALFILLSISDLIS